MSEEASGEAAPLIEPTAETPLVEGEATETKEDGTAEAEDVEAPASNLEPSIVADFVLVLRADKKPRGKASKEFDFAWQWIESKLSAATRTLDVRRTHTPRTAQSVVPPPLIFNTCFFAYRNLHHRATATATANTTTTMSFRSRLLM
jgi:hypothetical protein